MPSGGPTRKRGRARLRVPLVAGCLLAAGLLPGEALGAISFEPAATKIVTQSPDQLAVGDFNADGDPDVAATRLNGTSTVILTGAPGVSFTGPVELLHGTQPRGIAIADFNADDDPDLAVAGSANVVGIHLGAGGSSFGSVTTFPAGVSPEGIVAADFDGDSDPDLAVSNNGGAGSILVGGAGGSFGAPAAIAPGGGSFETVAAGYFNADGDIDLAFTRAATDEVAILLGDNVPGTADFLAATTVANAGDNPVDLAVGELSGDSDPDIAVGTFGGSSPLGVLVGAAGGAFIDTQYSAGTNPSQVALADFDGDGLLDIAVARFSADVEILRQLEGGGFARTGSFQPQSPAGDIAVGDWDGDGAPDLVVSSSNANTVSFLRNTSNADVTAPDVFFTSGPAGLTNDATPTFGFAMDEPGSFECRVDGNAFAACTSPHTTPELNDGAHSFDVRGADESGNRSVVTRQVQIDTTPPQTQIASAPARVRTKKKKAKVTIRFYAAEGGARFECKLDSAKFSACSSPFKAKVKRGKHTFRVRATDRAANTDPTPAGAKFRVVKR